MREMKDSGIEWIGAIPQDWQLSKIGSLYMQRNEKVSDKDYQPCKAFCRSLLPLQRRTTETTENWCGLETLQSTAALTVVVLVVFLR